MFRGAILLYGIPRVVIGV
nr:hypothetical protein [Methylomonas koyamae]